MAKKEKRKKVDEGYPEGKVDANSTDGPLTAEEISEKYKVPELKYILKENGLKVSGKKQDLVERVLPILNADLAETSGGDEKEVSAQTEDHVNLADLPLQTDEELLDAAVSFIGMDYDDLAIKERISRGNDGNLNIDGFTQDGLVVSDATVSMGDASDSSSVDFKMNVPEVYYTNFENTIFAFKNLDLSVLPSSNPKGIEFSALVDSLEIITETSYVNLKGINLFFKSYPEDGIHFNIGMESFLYPNFKDTTVKFEDIDFNLAIGANGNRFDVLVNLSKLDLINKGFKINLSDLDLNIALPDLSLSSLDLSILMPDFHYTNFDDVIVDMDNVNVSLAPTGSSNSVNALIGMDGLDATGLNSFDSLFPMLEITDVNFKIPANDSESPINLTCLLYLLDITQMDLTTLGAILSSGFDLDTYMRNIPDYYKDSLDGEAGILDALVFELGNIFEKADYSCFDAIELNLADLLDSADIDLADFGIDVSDYDLSSIKLSDFIDALSGSEFVQSAIAAVSKVFSLDLESLDMSDIIAGFDTDNFDISGLLASLDLSDVDISAIADMFANSGVDLTSVFKKIDYSCLGAIVLDLSGLIDSLGIDLADFGIDLPDVDLSAIKLSDLIDILRHIDIDMSTIVTMFKLFGIDLEGIDLSGLVTSFDVDNFDISGLLASLDLSDVDISAIADMLANSDIDLEGIFENADLSCLSAIELNLNNLIYSMGIDLADLGLDLSDYDTSSISLSELIEILGNLDLDMSTIAAILKLFDLELDGLDFDGLVAGFDEDSLDLSGLVSSLDLSELDIPAMSKMFSNMDIDWEGVFENCDYSGLDGIVLDLTGLIDSSGIDLADLGLDVSDCDLSSIKLPDFIALISDSEADMSQLDLSDIDFESLDLSGLVVGFDEDSLDLSGLVSGLDLSDVDISAIDDMFTSSGIDFDGVFENVDLSGLGAIELNLNNLIYSMGIDLADLGIDLSDYDTSSISLSELIGVLTDIDLDMATILSMLKLSNLELDNLDFDGLIAGFDADSFDMSSLVSSLDLSELDISAIMDMFASSDIDLAGIFENADLSCLGAIGLDLTGLIDSADIDLADFGIDVTDYDLSAITLSDLMDIFTDLDLDMTTIAVVLKLLGLDMDSLDLSGLVASFDKDNFDISGLLASLNLPGLDIQAMVELLNNMDVDWEGIFENVDVSCLDNIVLNLAGLLDSADIDLADFGIDVSDYDLSAIKLSDFVNSFCDSDFIKTAAAAISKLFGMDFNDLDFDGLVAGFDEDNFDISGLMDSLNLPEELSGILEMFEMNGVDLTEFMNNLAITFMSTSVEEIPE